MADSAGVRWAILGLLVGLGLGGGAIFLVMQPRTSPPVTTLASPPTTLPSPLPTVSPAIEPPLEVVEVKPGTAAAPSVPATTPAHGEPKAPAKTPPRVAKLMTDAKTAAGSSKYEEAAGLYEKALGLDPTNPLAQAGRSDAVAAAAMLRAFSAGMTEVVSNKPTGADLAGFDATGIGVKRAPAAIGRVELEVIPARVKPGDPYNIHVSLLNEDGKKEIGIQELKVSMLADGKWTSVRVTPLAHDVPPHKKQLVAELPGIWKNGLDSWALEVTITSKRMDVYKNRLTWR
jgi:hypothetical protein